jgi:hypothetical protein
MTMMITQSLQGVCTAGHLQQCCRVTMPYQAPALVFPAVLGGGVPAVQSRQGLPRAVAVMWGSLQVRS